MQAGSREENQYTVIKHQEMQKSGSFSFVGENKEINRLEENTGKAKPSQNT
jgi:hypothetical protein